MAIFKKQQSTGGAWLDKKLIESGSKAKLVSETKVEASEYEGKATTRNIVKIRIEGEDDSKNVALNKPTTNGLIDAFGEDSKEWINKELTVETEKTRIGGRAGIAIYLIPEGYEKVDDDQGYAIIQKIGGSKSEVVKDMGSDIPIIEPGDDIDVKDIPF